MDLFGSAADPAARLDLPLAARARPTELADFVGQTHLLGPGRVLGGLVRSGRPFSAVFAGPPGTGKTTLARIVARLAKAEFVALNAVVDKVADVRRELEAARVRRTREGRPTILFIDEVHRFSRTQQDVLLPGLEEGIVHLLATTTENPNANLTAPLLSRLSVFHFRGLSSDEVLGLLRRALALAREAGLPLEAGDEELLGLARGVSGDVRQALTLLESAARLGGRLDAARLEELLATTYREYDKSGDQHYDQVSAFIKSIRGSDPDAGLYWMARMLAGGEDPRFLVRRLVILASEDIGNADPQALPLAVAAAEAVDRIGMPEGRIVLAQAVTYLACCPKSNAAYLALGRAEEAVAKSPRWTVPKHLRNWLAKGDERAAGYQYPHDDPEGFLPQAYLPRPIRLYEPKDVGHEAVLRARLAKWEERRRAAGITKPGTEPEGEG